MTTAKMRDALDVVHKVILIVSLPVLAVWAARDWLDERVPALASRAPSDPVPKRLGLDDLPHGLFLEVDRRVDVKIDATTKVWAEQLKSLSERVDGLGRRQERILEKIEEVQRALPR